MKLEFRNCMHIIIISRMMIMEKYINEIIQGYQFLPDVIYVKARK